MAVSFHICSQPACRSRSSRRSITPAQGGEAVMPTWDDQLLGPRRLKVSSKCLFLCSVHIF